MAGVRGGHPGKVEMDSLDRGVAAGHDIVLGVVRVEARPDGGVVLARDDRVSRRREVRKDLAQQLALTDAFKLHQPSSIARRRRVAASGSRASATARMTHARRKPSAVSRGRLVSSMPPIAKTGTAPAVAAIAATPSGPITFFSVLIGVAKAGPLPR